MLRREELLSPDQLHTLVRGNPNAHYGEVQARVAWLATDDDTQQPLGSAEAPEFLWRVSAIGTNVTFQLTYGTRTSLSVDSLLSPFVGFIPGRFDLQARRIDSDAVGNAECTVTCATGGTPRLHQIASAAGAFHPAAVRATALTAPTTLTVGGVGVTLAAVGAAVPLVAPAALVAGDVIVELDL